MKMMKCSAVGVFVIGAVIGGTSALMLAASDPAIRHRMCCRARRAGKKAMHRAESWIR